MIAVVRTRTLHALRDQAEAAEAAVDVAREMAAGQREELRAALARTTADAARAEGELKALRAQTLLDTEDRAALRMLLRTARKQSRAADRVYVLFHRGELHSVHATIEDAEATAEAAGAPRSGWTAHTPGAALPPAAEVQWRVQPLPFGGAQ